jgi:hypothetical protein
MACQRGKDRTIKLTALTLVFLVGLAVAVKSAEPRGRAVTKPGAPQQNRGNTDPGPVTVTVRGLYQKHSAAYWHWRYQHRTRQYQHARRTLLSRPSVSEAINLASVVYGYGATLWRKARCESRLNPWAKNGSEASGLFQFLPSTWATTPFAGFSVWSPYANALAAGWMHARGRGGEWVCA